MQTRSRRPVIGHIAGAFQAPSAPRTTELSRGERQVAELFVTEDDDVAIGRALRLQVVTVQSRIESMHRKLGTEDRAELAKALVSRGLAAVPRPR